MDSSIANANSTERPAHVLVVEDEPKLAGLMYDYLVAAGYRVTLIEDGLHAVEWIRNHAPDAILLDLMLPGKDGLSICREVRAFSMVPILMVTARIDEIDRLLGLELGADDYICKPYSPREVIARVKAVMRRAQPVSTGETTPLQLDEERLEARLRGTLLPLTPVEFRLLQALQLRPGRVLSRTHLLDALYLDHRVVSDRTVDSHIKNVRRKIADIAPELDPIVSIYGVGYKLDWTITAAITAVQPQTPGI